jgi:hypothetical protein
VRIQFVEGSIDYRLQTASQMAVSHLGVPSSLIADRFCTSIANYIGMG